MSDFGAQERFFKELRTRFARKGDLVRELSELLNVSPSSVYRRLNGEQFLSIDELVGLARRYAISLDAIAHREDGPIPFNHSPFSDPAQSFEGFVHFIHQQVSALPKDDKTRLLVCTQDLPPLLYFGYPELLAFKKYIHGLRFQSNGQQPDVPYQSKMLAASASGEAEACADLYRSVSSIDIWGLNMLDTTLRQIEYVAAADRFSEPAQAYLLCDQLHEIISTSRAMARDGHKRAKLKHKPTFGLYVNDLMFTANIVLARNGKRSYLLTSLGTPSALASNHEAFCSHLETWFDQLAEKSASISVHDDKTREAYFSGLRDKIEKTRKNLFR